MVIPIRFRWNMLMYTETGLSGIGKTESVFVNDVIGMLQYEPGKWKARWFDDDLRICKSIRCGDILVMYDTGQIIHPLHPVMTRVQKKRVIRLAKEIINRPQ